MENLYSLEKKIKEMMKVPSSVYFLAAFTVAFLIYLRYVDDDDPTPSALLRAPADRGKSFLASTTKQSQRL